MNIKLTKATFKDLKTIHQMQVIAFKPLLDKYQDFDMSPGNETIDKIEARFAQTFTDYYLIESNENTVGAIRIIKNEREKKCRVSPIFILPEYQGNGIAQAVFKEIELMYDWANKWLLDTIQEEQGNCYLYEKIGYKKTGKTETINELMTIVYYEKLLVK